VEALAAADTARASLAARMQELEASHQQERHAHAEALARAEAERTGFATRVSELEAEGTRGELRYSEVLAAGKAAAASYERKLQELENLLAGERIARADRFEAERLALAVGLAGASGLEVAGESWLAAISHTQGVATNVESATSVSEASQSHAPSGPNLVLEQRREMPAIEPTYAGAAPALLASQVRPPWNERLRRTTGSQDVIDSANARYDDGVESRDASLTLALASAVHEYLGLLADWHAKLAEVQATLVQKPPQDNSADRLPPNGLET
jgi:hypothetical protein